VPANAQMARRRVASRRKVLKASRKVNSSQRGLEAKMRPSAFLHQQVYLMCSLGTFSLSYNTQETSKLLYNSLFHKKTIIQHSFPDAAQTSFRLLHTRRHGYVNCQPSQRLPLTLPQLQDAPALVALAARAHLESAHAWVHLCPLKSRC